MLKFGIKIKTIVMIHNYNIYYISYLNLLELAGGSALMLSAFSFQICTNMFTMLNMVTHGNQ